MCIQAFLPHPATGSPPPCMITLSTCCSLLSPSCSPLQDRIASLNGRTVQYVIRQDKAAFIRLIGISVLQSGASAVLAPSLRHVADALAMTWRRRLTAAAHSRYFKGNTFYTTSQLAGAAVPHSWPLPHTLDCSCSPYCPGWSNDDAATASLLLLPPLPPTAVHFDTAWIAQRIAIAYDLLLLPHCCYCRLCHRVLLCKALTLPSGVTVHLRKCLPGCAGLLQACRTWTRG